MLLLGTTGSVSVVTCWPLTSLVAKGIKFLLPLETRKVACGSTIASVHVTQLIMFIEVLWCVHSIHVNLTLHLCLHL